MPSPNLDTEEAATAPQSERAQLRLRELVVGGGIERGVRITELALVERLGMSRTPIRAAFVRLQEEGLLEALPGGGFTVREFSHADICDAIELRGTLEGLAARMAAESGADGALTREAQGCVQQLDEVLAPPQLSAAAFARYVKLNGQLHGLLAQMSGSPLVQRQIDRACMLPFASPSSFVIVHTTGARARDRLVIAHEQHHAVLDALARREGARAEALMREHARNAQANLGAWAAEGRRLQRARNRPIAVLPRAPIGTTMGCSVAPRCTGFSHVSLRRLLPPTLLADALQNQRMLQRVRGNGLIRRPT